MLPARFWQLFWMIFISLIGSLGIALGMVAGRTLAQGDYSVAVTAVVLAAMCGCLCIVAEETREDIPTWR